MEVLRTRDRAWRMAVPASVETSPPPDGPGGSGPAAAGERVATGITELDAYLGGGIPAESVVLVVGPPFSGRDLVAGSFLSAGLAEADAFAAVLTDADVLSWRRRLGNLYPEYGALEMAGIAHYIDVFSQPAADIVKEPYTHYLDSPATGEKTMEAVQREVTGPHALPVRRFVMSSLSTFAALTEPSVSLLLVMRLTNLLHRLGIAGLLVTDATAGADIETQNMKNHVDGAIEMRDHGGDYQMRVMGLGLERASPWVSYRIEGQRIVITDSWNVVRIVD